MYIYNSGLLVSWMMQQRGKINSLSQNVAHLRIFMQYLMYYWW